MIESLNIYVMTDYKVSYTEVCYLGKRLSIQFSVPYKPNSFLIPTTSLNIYSTVVYFIH